MRPCGRRSPMQDESARLKSRPLTLAPSPSPPRTVLPPRTRLPPSHSLEPLSTSGTHDRAHVVSGVPDRPSLEEGRASQDGQVLRPRFIALPSSFSSQI